MHFEIHKHSVFGTVFLTEGDRWSNDPKKARRFFFSKDAHAKILSLGPTNKRFTTEVAKVV